jgi:hypothetical protein
LKKEAAVATDICRTFTGYNGLFGRDVFSADGKKIGMFDQVVFSSFKEAPYLLVKTGPLGRLFYSDALYIPESELNKVTDKGVTMKRTLHELQESGYIKAPQGVDRW